MKRSNKLQRMISLTALLSFFMLFGYGQNVQSQGLMDRLLVDYYNIKDALVGGDGNAAATAAGKMLTDVNNIEVTKLSKADQTAYKPLQYKLEYDVRHISEVKDISHQREHFQTLSQNMYELAKNARLSGAPVYREYCPMKNASWLSNETAIKNPYYGSAMLKCGSVTDTIK